MIFIAKKKGNSYIIDEENAIVKIELHRRNQESLYTIIDLEDLEKVVGFPYSWFAQYDKDIDNYYAKSSVYNTDTKRSKPLFLHQFIMDANGKIVDHKNSNTLDNRKSNLRVVADSNNSKNRKGKNKNNTSGYRNVCWNKNINKWIVQMQINKKHTVLGQFDDVHEAGVFAEKMRLQLYGEFAGKN